MRQKYRQILGYLVVFRRKIFILGYLGDFRSAGHPDC